MRIGIITFHRAYNCGAMLQAWALKTVLERMGHVVEFPVLNHVGDPGRWQHKIPGGRRGLPWLRGAMGAAVINALSIGAGEKSYRGFIEFRKKNLPERDCGTEDLAANYDALIFGSDQIWNEKWSRQWAPVFFAENLCPDIHKVVYAASYGDGTLPDGRRARILDATRRFSKISMREQFAAEWLSRLCQREIQTVVDPTLLLTENDFAAIESDELVPDEPYLFIYTVSGGRMDWDVARRLARRLGVKCVISPGNYYSRYGMPRDVIRGIAPHRFLGLMRHAKYVLASSFHGTVFGALCKKPTLSLLANVTNRSRAGELARLIGREDILVTPLMSDEEMISRLNDPLGDVCLERIGYWRRLSIEWLKNAISYGGN